MSQKKDPKDTYVLVTGGAGFIGSHTVVELLQSGYHVVIVDDLSNSSERVIDRIGQIVGEEAASRLAFRKLDVNDKVALEKVFEEFPIDRVIHFAAIKPSENRYRSLLSTTATTWAIRSPLLM